MKRTIVTWVFIALLVGGGTGLLAQTPNVPGSPGSAATPSTQTPGSQAPAGAQPGSVAPKLPTGGENQLFIEVKTGYNNTKIEPDTRGPDGRPIRSFLTPGDNVVADFTFFQDHSFGGSGSNRIQILGIFRNTNDIRIDPEQNSFQRGYIRISTPNSEVNFGDYLVNYSRFTYNQNIKGVNLVRKFSDNFRFLANAGVFTDRWGSVFKDYISGKPFTRIVAGFRAEGKISNDKILGVNFSHGRDLANSIRPDLRGGFIAANNQILSFDTRMSFGRVFSLDAEIARSWTNPDTDRFKVKRSDYGGRLDTTFRTGPFFLRTSYTRLMPDFLSLNARQLADLQDTGVRGGFDIGPHVTLEGAYRQTSNNLRNDRPDKTTTFRVPEVRMSLRQVPHFGRAIFDLGYRERQQEGPFRTTFNNYEDKVTRIPFVEASIPLGATLLSFGYEHRDNQDRRVAGQDTATNRVSFGLRSIFDLGGWSFSPLLRYEIERELFLRVSGANNNRTIQASMFVEAPKYVVLEFIYRQIGATLFSECLTSTSDFCQSLVRIPANTIVLLPGGFGRPAYRGAITFKIRNSEDRNLIFSVDQNDNLFALTGRNFSERIVAVTFLYRFKK